MLRDQFPILDQQVYGHPLIYLDNAATTQKPLSVVKTLSDYYLQQNSNIHRGAHHLAEQATERYEAVRRQVQQFIGAAHSHEIVFTRGTTESINLVASSFGWRYLHPGDEVVVSEMEHHSNIVPWQLACERQGAHLRVLPFDESGMLQTEQLESLLNEHTRLVAVTQVSNTLGTVNPLRDIIATAHRHDIPVLVDGAQGIAHMPVDVQELDCDFYCFSAHKMYGPMGVGVLYGRERWLDAMPPYQGGGEMIQEVKFTGTTYNELPFKFEAGTPAVAEVLGLGSAIDFMQQVGIDSIARHEQELLTYATQQLQQIDGLRIFGNAPEKTAVVSFLLSADTQTSGQSGIHYFHPYDVGTLLDKLGIAVRTGHHCTQPVMDHFGIPGTVRASFAIYNTKEEVDELIRALERIVPMLG